MSASHRLASFRDCMGWSDSELGRKIGLHQTNVSRLIRGERGPSLATAHAIEKITESWPDGPIRTEEWVTDGPREVAQ